MRGWITGFLLILSIIGYSQTKIRYEQLVPIQVTQLSSTGVAISKYARANGTNGVTWETIAGSEVSNTATGNITSINVQAAINELDAKKVPKLEPIRNETGSTIATTKVVYNSGFNNLPLIALADNTDENKHNVIGLTVGSLAHQTNGNIATLGTCDAETNGWVVGTELYLGTAGSLTNVEPTSGSVQHVGIVQVQANYPTGKILLYLLPEGNTVASGSAQNVILRVGDAAGSNKVSVRNYTNTEVASINSLGQAITVQPTTTTDTYALTTTSGMINKELKKTAFNKDLGTTTGTVLEGRTFGTAANSATTDFAPSSGSGNYVQVSPAAEQSGNIWMGGNSVIGGYVDAGGKGIFAGDYVYRKVSNDLFSIYGSSNANSATWIKLFGDLHATTPNVISIGTSGNEALRLASTGVATFASTVNATQLQSTVATGTAPLTVASTTMVGNLNADLLDGYHKTEFTGSRRTPPVTMDLNTAIDSEPYATTMYAANVATNSPNANPWWHISEWNHDNSTQWRHQLALDYFSDKIYFRRQQSSDWQSWRELWHSGNLINPITGTGTSGYIPKFTGTGSFGDSPIYTYGTNIGIGTTTPVLRTHIVANQSGAFPATSGTTQTGGVLRLQNWDSGGVLDFGVNSGNGWLQVTYDSDLGVTYPLLLNPNGGNVGIGTTAPHTKISLGAGTVNSAQSHISVWEDGGGSYGMGVVSNGTNIGLGIYAYDWFTAMPKFLFSDNGCLAINNPSTTEITNNKLAVNGSAFVNGGMQINGVTNILGGSTLGLTFRSNGIYTEEYDGFDGITVNYRGYANGTTQFRSFSVFDGKTNPVLSVNGQTKETTFYGVVNSTGYLLNGNNLFSSLGTVNNGYLPYWNGTNFVDSKIYRLDSNSYGCGDQTSGWFTNNIFSFSNGSTININGGMYAGVDIRSANVSRIYADAGGVILSSLATNTNPSIVLASATGQLSSNPALYSGYLPYWDGTKLVNSGLQNSTFTPGDVEFIKNYPTFKMRDNLGITNNRSVYWGVGDNVVYFNAATDSDFGYLRQLFSSDLRDALFTVFGTIKSTSLASSSTRLVTASSTGQLGLEAGTGLIKSTAGVISYDTNTYLTSASLPIEIYSETPSGTPNGALQNFTLAHTPTTGTVRVYLNGLRMKPTTHYTVSGSTISFIVAPITDDIIIIDYKY